MNKVKLNPCQDCGCSPGQLKVRIHPSPIPRGYNSHLYFSMLCPYCKRETKMVSAYELYNDEDLLTKEWNKLNPAFEGGLL